MTLYLDVILVCYHYLCYNIHVTKLYNYAVYVFWYWYCLNMARDNSWNMLKYFLFLICAICWLWTCFVVESRLYWHDFLLYKCSNIWIRVRGQGWGFGGAAEDNIKLHTSSVLCGKFLWWGEEGFGDYSVAEGGGCYMFLVLFRCHCPTVSSTLLYFISVEWNWFNISAYKVKWLDNVLGIVRTVKQEFELIRNF
jgi:hypothetical protein